MSIEVIKKWRRRAEVAQAEARIWKDACTILHGAVNSYLGVMFSGGEQEIALGQLYQAAQSLRPNLGDRRAAIAYQEAVILRILTQYYDMQRSTAVWSGNFETVVDGLMQALFDEGHKWYSMMKEQEHEAEKPEEPEQGAQEQGSEERGHRAVDGGEAERLHGPRPGEEAGNPLPDGAAVDLRVREGEEDRDRGMRAAQPDDLDVDGHDQA